MASINPSSCAITLLDRCNLACKTCYADAGPNANNAHSFDEMRVVLLAIAARGIRHVFLGGGEPLMHPHLVEIYKFARGLNLEVSISSNGHLVTPHILQRLGEAGLTHGFTISLDGPDEQTNAALRGKGSFLPTLMGMYNLMKYENILWGLNYVCAKPNLGKALATAQCAERLGAGYFNLIRVTHFGRAALNQSRLAIGVEDFACEEQTLLAVYPKMGNFYADVHMFDLGNIAEKGMRSLFDDPSHKGVPSGFSIDARGNVALTPANILLGNCRREDLYEILKSIEEAEVQERYSDWLLGKRQGIHQPLRTTNPG